MSDAKRGGARCRPRDLRGGRRGPGGGDRGLALVARPPPAAGDRPPPRPPLQRQLQPQLQLLSLQHAHCRQAGRRDCRVNPVFYPINQS